MFNKNYYEANLLLNSILGDIKNIDFYYDLFNLQKNISLEENGVVFEIKKIDKTNVIILNKIFGDC